MKARLPRRPSLSFWARSAIMLYGPRRNTPSTRRGEEMTEQPLRHTCPVCGFDGLAKPAYDEGGFGSLEVCPSCGFQFNISDTRHGWSFHDWRNKWVSDGMPWSSATTRPPRNWNPQNQLGHLRAKDRNWPDG